MLRNTRVPKYDGAISASNGRRFACVILMGLVQVVVIGSILGFGPSEILSFITIKIGIGRSQLGKEMGFKPRDCTLFDAHDGSIAKSKYVFLQHHVLFLLKKEL